jgi:hypothetical protein
MTEILSDLVDATQMARHHPETFTAPSTEELAKLRVGDSVKVCRHNERFWITLTKVEDLNLEGAIDSVMINDANSDLPLGRLVVVNRCHVFEAMFRWKGKRKLRKRELNSLRPTKGEKPA